MRIALFHNLPSGGAKRHTYEQVRELVSRGHEIHEFTQSTADLDFIPLGKYVADTRVYDLPWRHLRQFAVPGVGPYVHLWQNSCNLHRLSTQSHRIAADIDSGAFDLVFVKDCMFTLAPSVLRWLETPTLFYMHSTRIDRSSARIGTPTQGRRNRLGFLARLPSDLQTSVVQRAHTLNLRCADRVLTNSWFTREVVLRMEHVAAEVVYPGVDTDVFFPRQGDAQGSYVLSVGSLHPQKGHHFVIEAVGLLPAASRPRLVIAAVARDSDYERFVQQLAERHGVRVEITSIHDSAVMAQLYADALALAFAPTLEPLGLVALEAMACGTPVVGLREGGLRETIEDGKTGLLVDRDTEEFAAALRSLLEDDELRRILGENGRRCIEGYWNWTRAVDDLEAQFAALLKDQPCP